MITDTVPDAVAHAAGDAQGVTAFAESCPPRFEGH